MEIKSSIARLHKVVARNATMDDLMSEDFGQLKIDWREALYKDIEGEGDVVNIEDYRYFNFSFFMTKSAAKELIEALKLGKFQLVIRQNVDI